MKNILVCTDFSKQAFTAAVFAAELARRSGARLILFHAYHRAILLEDAYIWANSDVLEKEVQQKIDELAQQLHQVYGISITRILKPGFAVDEIIYLSKTINPDLLVLGTDGAGFRQKELLGKITAEVLKKTEIPLVCIPPEATLESFAQLTLLPERLVPLGNTAGLHLFNSFSAGIPAAALPSAGAEPDSEPKPSDLSCAEN